MPSHLQPKPASPRRVVVLGSRGFFGRELIGFLTAQGCECWGVPRQEVDLCEPGAAERLAAILEPGSEVTIESLPRSGPVTHRHFDKTALARSVPLLRPIPLDDALGQSIRDRRRAPADEAR